jgi:hypothetical protein
LQKFKFRISVLRFAAKEFQFPAQLWDNPT